MSSPFQIPYREARDGIWGEQTSTLNWCEEDYNITPYCAELVNTLTNLIFMYLGFKGIRNCILYGHPPVFIVAYIGYLFVGFGSMAFHSTLKYSMQLADELPMIYTTYIMTFATFSYSKSPRFAFLVGLGLFSLALFITAYYHLSKNPVFHQVAFASTTAATVFRGMYIMEAQLRPAIRKRSQDTARADKLMKQMWMLAATGISAFLIGFGIWNLDNIYCHHLRRMRDYIMLPWAIVLEGHGWWHLFTGLGAYYFIVWRIWLEKCLDGSEHDFTLVWPSPLTSVPEVVPVEATSSSNGVKSPTKKVQ